MYTTYSAVAFIIPYHPEAYPANALDDPRIQTKETAENEAKVKEYEKGVGVIDELRTIVKKKVKREWMEECKHKATNDCSLMWMHRQGHCLQQGDDN